MAADTPTQYVKEGVIVETCIEQIMTGGEMAAEAKALLIEGIYQALFTDADAVREAARVGLIP